MRSLVASTFRRYLVEHVALTRPGFPLIDIDGRRLGHVDRISVARGRLRAEGWALAESVELVSALSRTRVPVNLLRADVTEALGASRSDRVGFSVAVRFSQSAARLLLAAGGYVYVYPIAPFSWRQHRLAVAAAGLRFLWTGVRLLPEIARYAATGSRPALAEIKSRLGFIGRDGSDGPQLLDDRLFADGPVGAFVPEETTTVIVPVYNGFELLPEVLGRLRTHTDAPYRVIVIDDRSTDPKVAPFLRRWADEDAGRVVLLENERNLGFIGSVNRALPEAQRHAGHVVLLNSDALVPEGWLTRLIRPICTLDRVASTTPMSNDAEILSVPAICRPSPLAPGQGDRIDRTAARFAPAAARAELPTGVGFCMAINRAYLDRIPELDASFGRGYGEEVDWCRKALRLGGRHLAVPELFVEHRGGVSFGSAAKRELLRRNGRMITRRYPEFDGEVQRFIREDPLLTPRLALALAEAASAADAAVNVYIAHTVGGGADKYLEKRIAEDAARGRPSVILRVGGAMDWTIELCTEHGRIAGTTPGFDLVERLLEPLEARHVVYSCAVGARDPLSMPEAIRRLCRTPGATLEILFHDFFLLSPSYCLLDGDGFFRGVPPADSQDPAHRFTGGRGPVELAEWRAAWGAVVARADTAVAFSRDSRAHVLEAYPALADRLVVRPHCLCEPVPQVPRRPLGDEVTIGVLGNIGYQKGAKVVAEMSHRLAKDRALNVAVIGNIDPAYGPHPSLVVHGDYQVQDIPRLVEGYGIDAWLIPSVWPETFSYTTHEALATGLPVFCFDLGGQAEAVRAAANGHLLDTGLIEQSGERGAPPERVILNALRQAGGAVASREGTEAGRAETADEISHCDAE